MLKDGRLISNIRLSHVRYSNEVECVQAIEKRGLMYATSEARVGDLCALDGVDDHICVVIQNDRSEVRVSKGDRRGTVGKDHPILPQAPPSVSYFSDTTLKPEIVP
jgi:hypothetical protein